MLVLPRQADQEIEKRLVRQAELSMLALTPSIPNTHLWSLRPCLNTLLTPLGSS